MTGPANERGFTLVEMLVALVIFAVLASAGVGLLRASVDSQQVVSTSLADLSAAGKLRLLLRNDLSQAVVRPIAVAPQGFSGEAQRFHLVRAAESMEPTDGEAGLEAVRWALDGDRLVRTAIASDGTPIGQGVPVARGVTRLSVRFRDSLGQWKDGWTGVAPEQALPAAVWLSLERSGEAPVNLIVALPPGPAPALVPSVAEFPS